MPTAKRNVAGIFSVAPETRTNLSGRPGILIDDVMATGAIMNAAIDCLLSAGSGPVDGRVLARVLQKTRCALWIILYAAIEFDNGGLTGRLLYDHANGYEPRPLSCEWYYGKS